MIWVRASWLGILWHPGDRFVLEDKLQRAGTQNRRTSGPYFLATSTSLIEILGSSNWGTVLIRALISSIVTVFEWIERVMYSKKSKRYLPNMLRRSSKGGTGGNTMPGPVVGK
jgi:amino acid transporter